MILVTDDIIGTDSWIKQRCSLSKGNVFRNGETPIGRHINVTAKLLFLWVIRIFSIFAEFLFTIPANFAVFAALSDQSNSYNIANFSHADFGSNSINNTNDLVSNGFGIGLTFGGENLVSNSEVQYSNSNFMIKEWGMFETYQRRFETRFLTECPGHSFSCSPFYWTNRIARLIAHVQLDLYFVKILRTIRNHLN